MTDSTLDGLEAAMNEPSGRKQCAYINDDLTQCPEFVPDGSHPARKFCDTHFVGGKRDRPRKESAPKLVVEMGGGKKGTTTKDKRAKDTAAGAIAFMNVVATGVAMSGDQLCAAAFANGATQWGEAVGELSKYQPWLAQFFAPVGGDSQLGAWLGLLMATGAIALPVLAHHNLLPASVGAKLGGVMVAADDAASAPAA
jgi:hypothetical protein